MTFFVINLKKFVASRKSKNYHLQQHSWLIFLFFSKKDHFQTYFLCTTGTCMLIFRDPSTTTLRPPCDHQQTPLRSKRPLCLRSGVATLQPSRLTSISSAEGCTAG